MTDHNPVQIEAAIRECANRIGRGVTICANAYSAFLAADLRAYQSIGASVRQMYGVAGRGEGA